MTLKSRTPSMKSVKNPYKYLEMQKSEILLSKFLYRILTVFLVNSAYFLSLSPSPNPPMAKPSC